MGIADAVQILYKPISKKAKESHAKEYLKGHVFVMEVMDIIGLRYVWLFIMKLGSSKEYEVSPDAC